MVLHTIFSTRVENLQVELVYENYPIFCGSENISAVLRFRSLSQVPEPQLLVLGYTQILGYLTINDQILESSQFTDTKKKTTINGKVAGINGLEISHDKALLNGISSALSGFFNSEMGNLGQESASSFDLNYITKANLRNIVPFFTSKQNLLFTEQTMDSLYNYYVSLHLPECVPPSCSTTQSLTVNYSLVVGFQTAVNGELHNSTLFFPLRIQPYIDSNGIQPFYRFDWPMLNFCQSDSILDVAKEKSGRRLSFKMIKSQLEQAEPSEIEKRDFIALLKKLQSQPVEQLLSHQQEFETKFSTKTQIDTKSVVKSISQHGGIVSSGNTYGASGALSESNVSKLYGREMDPQIPKTVQKHFILKRRGHLFSQVSLFKGIFCVGETIGIKIRFENAQLQTTGLHITLNQVEVFSDKAHLAEDEYGSLENGELYTVVADKVVSCCINNEEVNTELVIPQNLSGQFKSDLVELKYVLGLRFILVDQNGLLGEKEKDSDESELVEIFKDEKGKLLKGVDFFTSGSEFVCRLPVVMLPSHETDPGRVVQI